MKRSQRLPELLAPAGDYECLIAAITAGADAVYLGGVDFGARAFAKNFTEEQLASAVRLCHMHGVRLYVTVNTLILDKELLRVTEYAKRLYEMGVDALIVADVGLCAYLREAVPDMELHASTQMGVHNAAGADFAYSLGCARVVLARECNGKDIKAITEKARAECEVFIHGALCVCHSGQCLFSSMVGGRSGNRGECAQPCRLPYNNGKYPLSLCDLSLSGHVRELIEYGVSSLKIEGRMKSPSYVYEVTSVYRRLLDEQRCAAEEDNRRLRNIFSRGGFTDGYFTKKIDSGMTGVRSSADKAKTREASVADITEKKLAVSASAEIKLNSPSKLTLKAPVFSRWGDLTGGELAFTSVGASASEAKSSPLTTSGVKARLAKMGSTSFSLSESDIELDLDEGVNMSPSALNELRRNCASGLSELYAKPLAKLCGEEQLAAPRVEFLRGEDAKRSSKSYRTALFFSAKTLVGVIGRSNRSLEDIDVIFVPLEEYGLLGESKLWVSGIYLPPVISESEWQSVREQLLSLTDVRYVLVGNISHLSLIKDTGLTPIGDFRLNITNCYSAALYRSFGVEQQILSAELTLPQIRDIGGGAITMGRVPLMLTERCFIKESFGCSECNKAALVDRYGAKFPMMREFGHRNIILNSAPTYLGDKKDGVSASALCHEHFIFSTESVGECINMLDSYRCGKPLSCPVRRIGKRNQ